MWCKFLYISLCIFVFSVLKVSAQQNDSGAVSFLKITPDARSGGMGEIGVALPTNAFAFYHNAAAVVFAREKAAIAYSYIPWMRDKVSGYDFHTGGGFFKIGEKQGIVAGFRYLTYPSIETIDEDGNSAGKAEPNEWAVDLGYSRVIVKNFALALTAHYIHSDMGMADAASAVAFDWGLYYHRKTSLLEGAVWTVGLQVANIGTKIKYADTKYDLPGVAKLGGSLSLPFSKSHQLLCGVDLNYQLIPSGSELFSGGVGAEYTFKQLVSVRGGYHFADEDKGGENYATVGCGLNICNITGDFSWLSADSNSALKNTYRLTVGYRFGAKRK